MSNYLTREQVEKLADCFPSDMFERNKKALLAHDAALRAERDEAMEALGYPMPYDPSQRCGKIVCGMCGPKDKQLAAMEKERASAYKQGVEDAHRCEARHATLDNLEQQLTMCEARVQELEKALKRERHEW